MNEAMSAMLAPALISSAPAELMRCIHRYLPQKRLLLSKFEAEVPFRLTTGKAGGL
jgi:hypothetical protein